MNKTIIKKQFIKKKTKQLNKIEKQNKVTLECLSNARTSIKRKITNNINEINLSWSRDTNKKEKANKTKQKHIVTGKQIGRAHV